MSDRHCIGKGAAAGFIAGIAGAWAMNQYWAFNANLKKQQASPEQLEEMERQGEQRETDNPTVKIAEAISEVLCRRKLHDHEKKIAGSLVHYGYGALSGAFYGAVAEVIPASRAGFGTAYAFALWAGGDEIAVPALGLSKSPTEYPLSQHLHGLAAHILYGVTAETVRRVLRWIW